MMRLIDRSSSEWPPLLLQAEAVGPPSQLYATGAPIDGGERVIGVVGTRRPTLTGIETTRRFCEAFAQGGFTVVSGLAVGVDAIAHKATLDAGGNTIAVLGCGLDVCYPRSNATLRKRIDQSGTVVTEYEPGTDPIRANFPRRNRIIAALARALVVIEGSMRSGALITARYSLDLNRDVFAVPGSVRNPMAAGPNELIRTAGAALVTDPQHVFNELAPGLVWGSRDDYSGAVAAIDLDESERRLLDVLDDVGAPIDHLCRASGLTPGALALSLARLQVRGLVAQRLGLYELTIAGSRAKAATAGSSVDDGALF